MTYLSIHPFLIYAWNLPLRALSQPIVAVRDHIEYKSTIRQLNHLSDRQLEDIGVIRSEIPLEARRGIYAF